MEQKILVGALTLRQWYLIQSLLLSYESPYQTIGEHNERIQDELEHGKLQRAVSNIIAEGLLGE